MAEIPKPEEGDKTTARPGAVEQEVAASMARDNQAGRQILGVKT